ncbi:MAG: endolytic transglycosylase MltG, partial [Chloroflexi bacterium]|nr:endolytic transglycosylase MltG [Chloroflexota bacterium]
IFALLILAVCAIIGGGGGLYWSLHHPQSSSSAAVTVHVGTGDTVTSVANRLQRAGMINSALLFRVDARLQNLAGKLKAGDYRLRRDMSIDEMVAAFTHYTQRYVRVAIPEGFRAEQIAARLQTIGINAAQFLAAVRHPDARVLKLPILQDKPPGRSLEGYLFPSTYTKLPRGFTAREMADFMVETLNAEFSPALRAGARRQGLTIYQTLTLASIVEREARLPSERPLVASVYLNRLHDRTQRWPLNADPTIQYVIGTPKRWWPVLRAEPKSIAPSSPYNTYTHFGLPPGPIANPGLASIEAVVNPPSTKYYYFVAKNDCLHQAFSETYEQQLANQQKYHCQA